MLLTLGVTEEDWSAWYRLFSHKRFDEEQTAEIMCLSAFTEKDELPDIPLFLIQAAAKLRKAYGRLRFKKIVG